MMTLLQHLAASISENLYDTLREHSENREPSACEWVAHITFGADGANVNPADITRELGMDWATLQRQSHEETES